MIHPKTTLSATALALLAPLSAFAQAAPAAAAEPLPKPGGIEGLILDLVGGQAVGFDHWVSAAFILVGIILSLLYLRGFYLVLHYASQTYDVPLDEVDDAAYSQSKERSLLIIGSLLLVLLSAGVIQAYGLGWLFLYLGPLLALAGPIVIIVAFEVDIRKYRAALKNAQASQA